MCKREHTIRPQKGPPGEPTGLGLSGYVIGYLTMTLRMTTLDSLS